MGSTQKLLTHVVEGRPWLEAIITVLEPRSTYRPWHTDDLGDINDGEKLVAILDTDPVAILATIGLVGPDADVHTALAGIRQFELDGPPALAELDTFNLMASLDIPASPTTLYRSEDAVARTVRDLWRTGMDGCFGHSTLAQARTLLASGGRCTGCEEPLPLDHADAAQRLHFHTADRPRRDADGQRQYTDWPAVLCDSCHDGMLAGRFETFLDYRFSLAPACPACSARRSQSADFGEPALGYMATPWTAHMGCCIAPIEWVCGACEHQWASPERLAQWSE